MLPANQEPALSFTSKLPLWTCLFDIYQNYTLFQLDINVTHKHVILITVG